MSAKFLPRRPGQDRRSQNDTARGLDLLKTEALSEAAAYTPADASLWSSPAPTTIQEALDRLAVAVEGAHGTIA